MSSDEEVALIHPKRELTPSEQKLYNYLTQELGIIIDQMTPTELQEILDEHRPKVATEEFNELAAFVSKVAQSKAN